MPAGGLRLQDLQYRIRQPRTFVVGEMSAPLENAVNRITRTAQPRVEPQLLPAALHFPDNELNAIVRRAEFFIRADASGWLRIEGNALRKDIHLGSITAVYRRVDDETAREVTVQPKVQA
jgi:hypothetical protein